MTLDEERRILRALLRLCDARNRMRYTVLCFIPHNSDEYSYCDTRLVLHCEHRPQVDDILYGRDPWYDDGRPESYKIESIVYVGGNVFHAYCSPEIEANYNWAFATYPCDDAAKLLGHTHSQVKRGYCDQVTKWRVGSNPGPWINGADRLIASQLFWDIVLKKEA